jgi:hypothetical protein
VNTKPSAKLVELVEEIQRDVPKTDSAYAENFISGLATHPIPYFGKLEQADVLTIGLNPSPGEFENGRWPDQTLAAERLADELHNYFRRTVPWHPWFDKWSAAFRQLDETLRYEDGRVAHIDLSPRATQIASLVPKPEIFAKMLQHDMQWLPALVECAKAARILLVAGTVTQRKYLIEFLTIHGGDNHIRVERRDGSSRRPLGFYDLHFRSRSLPAFFSGSGPSARDRGTKLIRNYSDNREEILARYRR